MNGILNVYKEQGFTSHDVVAKLRGILKMKKIGHTGTLDPDATGVLPVCVGRATKVCDLLTDKDKSYRAVVKLGVTTDTLDMTGEILEIKPVDVSVDKIITVLSQFTGEISQIPPMYSAIKVNGKKLYEMARKGQIIERKPRNVTIYELQMVEHNLSEQEFTIDVTCSKGTYIRTLCQDIGDKLGCGAAMKSLVRTRVDRFVLEEAKTLAEIEAIVKVQGADELLLPIDGVFEKYAAISVKEKGMKFLKNGNLVAAYCCEDKATGKEYEPKDGEKVRMYGDEGDFYAIYSYKKTDNMYHIVKMFHE